MMRGMARKAAHSVALRLVRSLWRWADRFNSWAARLFVAADGWR
jgi:hypothetical protein